jgi:glycosyltransferase involved in cell wall biosynthesis
MLESATSYHNLETPPPGATLPPGRQALRGWVLPKSGGHFVDVRARVQGRGFAGVHGLPRADLAAYFKTGRAHALAEFTIAVELQAGPADFVLEALDLSGRWQEFLRGTYRVDPALPAVDFAVPSGPLRWHEFGRALQILLRAQRRRAGVPLATLAAEVAAAIPYPRDLRHAPAPFLGHLDEPAAIARTTFGRSPVLGWLFHQEQAIARVFATYDLQAWQTLAHNQPSPGVGAHFPQWAGARACGVHGIIDVPAQLPDPLSVRVYAELADGSLHLCQVQRSRSYAGEEQKAPLPAQDAASFGASLAALRAALAGRGVATVEDDELRRELTRLEDDFRRRAPRTLPAPAALAGSPATTTQAAPARVLLVTHNLNLEGAPLLLADLAGHYAAAGSRLTVLSPADGPLRARLEAAGAAVVLVDAGPVFAAPAPPAAQAAIARLGAACDFHAFDLVVCNTFTTFWAVHAAKAAGCRVLLYIHESITPANFYHERMSPAVVALVEEAFGLADAVSFTTEATRRYHLDYGRPANHRLTPGWIEVGRLDHWLARNPRAALRAKFHLQPGELLVTNIGTVCERKGQHIFARAVDLLWRRDPALAARCRFVMLGGGDTAFDAALADLLVQLGRPNLAVHPATSDYLPYYAAADLFVCSTFEESSPRVILEAMACGTPILSSAVHGVTEQVRDGREARLVPAGDTDALATALAEILSAPGRAAPRTAAARARVLAEFDAPRVLPRHLALACELAARPR